MSSHAPEPGTQPAERQVYARVRLAGEVRQDLAPASRRLRNQLAHLIFGLIFTERLRAGALLDWRRNHGPGEPGVVLAERNRAIEADLGDAHRETFHGDARVERIYILAGD